MSTTNLGTSTLTLMDVLRESTTVHHHAAESHPFQATLNKGKAPIQAYGDYLQELLFLHQALENQLAKLARSDARVHAVVREYQYQCDNLKADLACLGRTDLNQEATPATKQAVASLQQMAAASPLTVLGMHYVLEGSKNGAKFISRNLARVYTLSRESGLKYFDPYGDHQREYWAQFKLDMNAQNFTEDESGVLVDGAVWMFKAIEAISGDLATRYGLEENRH